MLINTIFLVLFCLPNTVDHHLFRLLVSSRSDYLDWLMTVPLECFAESVRFIRELDVILHINVWASITYQKFSVIWTHLSSDTVCGKTFEWENLRDFHPIAKVFPLNHLLCTVQDGHGLMHHESFPVNSVFCTQPRKFSHSKVLPHTVSEGLLYQEIPSTVLNF